MISYNLVFSVPETSARFAQSLRTVPEESVDNSRTFTQLLTPTNPEKDGAHFLTISIRTTKH
jgi:hypothetical protein